MPTESGSPHPGQAPHVSRPPLQASTKATLLQARIEALGALGTTQLRHILEGVSVKDVASGELPEYVKKIAEDPAVWT